MSTGQMATLVWIVGWALTTWVFVQARRRYPEGNRRHRDRSVQHTIDAFSLHPPLSLLLFLLLWPVLLVGFTATLGLVYAERKMEEAEDEERRGEQSP